MATWSLLSSASATSALTGQLIKSRLAMLALADASCHFGAWPYLLDVNGEIGKIPYLSIPTNFESTAWGVTSTTATLNPS